MQIDSIERNFGRLVSPPDERDYALARFIAEPILDIAKIVFGERRVWTCDTVLDQGDSNHCVGFACAQFGNALPLDSEQTDTDADAIYRAAKQFDADPMGENGTTVRSGAKAMRQLGHIQAYAFAHSINEIATWLQNHGSVVIGTNWYRGMEKVDGNGYVHANGQLLGGHCWLLLGYDFTNPLQRCFIGLNSWGAAWGQTGRFKISANDLAALLRQGGEAMTAVEVAAMPQPVFAMNMATPVAVGA